MFHMQYRWNRIWLSNFIHVNRESDNLFKQGAHWLPVFVLRLILKEGEMAELNDIDDAVDGCHPLFRDAPSTVEFNKLRKRLLRHMRQALDDFSMVKQGQKWLVAVSGGKDSYGLLALLLDLKWRGLLPVDILACNLDQGQPGFPKNVLPDFLNHYEIPYRIEYQDTYSIVTEKLDNTQTYCSLCSRLRRGNLYRIAREEGCSALVLGHHRDDVLETFFMAEKIPSSVKVGSRPTSSRMRAYSSGFNPWAAIIAGVMAMSFFTLIDWLHQTTSNSI